MHRAFASLIMSFTRPGYRGRYAAKTRPMRLFFLSLVLSLGASSVAEDFVPHTALSGKVVLRAPKSFSPMSKDILDLKYPNSRRPTEVLSDATGGITVAFNHTKSRMAPSQVKEAHGSISKMFHNFYPSAKWIKDETIVQNGRAFMVLEFVTPALDTKIHNIMYGTSVDNRLLLVAFNTTVEQSEEWLPIGKQIMGSLAIKE